MDASPASAGASETDSEHTETSPTAAAQAAQIGPDELASEPVDQAETAQSELDEYL